MLKVYEEIKTPIKYGIVLKDNDTSELVDSPTVFRNDDQWYMSYIVFDGHGYETWLAESENLIEWENTRKILSYTKDGWDSNQKAGYMALVDIEWGGSYKLKRFDEKLWMSYLGGSDIGYEKGALSVGIVYSDSLSKNESWGRILDPVLMPNDKESN